MVRLILTACILFATAGANAQDIKKDKANAASERNKPANAELQQTTTAPSAPATESAPVRIDLSTAPAQPVNSSPVNASTPNKDLLQPSGTGPATPYRTTQTSTTPAGTTVQPVNATSNQFNLGGTKGTSTIYYDNSGKVTGSGTSIQLGGK